MKFKWPKIRKKSSAINYPTNYPTGYSQDWESYFSAGTRRNIRKKSFWQNFYRVLIAFAIFLVALTLRETEHPLGVQARESLKYALTTEWDYQPVLDKAVQIGLQTVSMEVPFFNDLPGTSPVLAPKTDTYYALPVSGTVIKEYGWVKEGADGLERFNPGIYISAEAGSEVKASRSGRVERVGRDESLGTYVLIEHNGNDYTLYAGLSEVYVSEDQAVDVQTIIGTVGENSDGISGLHFEIREDNKLVDPLSKLEGLTN